MGSGQLSRVLVAAVGTAAVALIVVLGIAMMRDVGDDDVGRADSELTVGADFDLPGLKGPRFVLGDHGTSTGVRLLLGQLVWTL